MLQMKFVENINHFYKVCFLNTEMTIWQTQDMHNDSVLTGIM
jgi:hypothetical protein